MAKINNGEPIGAYSPYTQPMVRRMTSNGLQSGTYNMNPVASLGSPVDYFIEAQPGERIAIGRMNVEIVDNGLFNATTYGALAQLANGIQIFNRRSGFVIDVTGPLVIKNNSDWGRFTQEQTYSDFGAGDNYFTIEWHVNDYGTPYGLVLEESDRLGFRIRDDLSGLVGHYAVIHATQLGVNSSEWITSL